MNTIFAFAPFRRFDLGTHARVGASMGQALGQDVVGNLLRDIGVSQGIENFIRDLPEAEKNFNRKRWEECKDMGLTTTKGAACALRVINDLREGRTKPDTVVTPPPAAPSSFPLVPVALGLAAAGGLVWYLASQGK